MNFLKRLGSDRCCYLVVWSTFVVCGPIFFIMDMMNGKFSWFGLFLPVCALILFPRVADGWVWVIRGTRISHPFMEWYRGGKGR